MKHVRSIIFLFTFEIVSFYLKQSCTLIISFDVIVLAPSFTYQCSKGYCGPTYGSAVEGSSEDVGRACSNDQPKCEAYQYSKTSGYGHLCSSEKNDGYHRDAQNCIKTEGNFHLEVLVRYKSRNLFDAKDILSYDE